MTPRLHRRPSSLVSFSSLLVCGAALASACGGDASTPSSSNASSGSASASTGVGGNEATGTYEFESSLVAGESSVAYAGQTLRHVLTEDLVSTIEGLTKRLDDASYSPTSVADTVALLDHLYAFDGQTSGTDKLLLSTEPPALQSTYDAIATGKSLAEKLAGNDPSTDHVDWSKAFAGWKDASIAESGGSIASPEGLLKAYFSTLGKLALDRQNGVIPKVPGTNEPIKFAHVTPTGLDLHELVEKQLEFGIAYAQATDDYLDDDVAGKGLLSPNERDGSAPYTTLAHAWDEAFGYFGAPRDYLSYTDAELAETGGRPDWQGDHDSNGDGKIDLTREHAFGMAVTAAKRDLGAKEPTDFTRDAFVAASQGRALIQRTNGALTPAELEELKGYRDAWVDAWERALGATVIRELNEVIAITGEVGTAKYDFYEHAQEWSELKGFALGFQYSPRSRVKGADFVKLHDLLGDRPVLATATQAERDAYVKSLLEARTLMGKLFNFSKANVEGW